MDLSASMIVDIKTPPKITAFKTRHPSVWVPDSRSTACFLCKQEFYLLRRKHHCRICNRIFCHECSDNYDTPISYLSKPNENVKMCNNCYSNQMEAKSVESIIIALAAMPLTMVEKWKCRLISNKWNTAWKHFSEIRHIQYKIPYKGYNKLERLWLGAHRNEFFKHNRLSIVDAIVTKNKPKKRTSKIKTPCKYLMCSSQCVEKYTDADVLEMITQGIQPKQYKKWMIPWIVMQGNVSVSIEGMMECKILNNYKLRDYTLQNLPHAKRIKFNKMCKLFATINKIIQYKDIETRKKIKKKLFEDNIVVEYPYSKELILDLMIENITDIDSNSKPVIIPFLMSDNTVRNILIKSEDVRNDRLAQVTLMWISKLSGIPVSTYKVIPTGPSSGWIELLENCTTLYDIKYNRETTIMNYIMDHNQHKTAFEIKKKFIRSVAVSCVLSYILGLGDRHLENILVSQSGELLHIDFGFLFGDDPHGFTPTEMRITRQTLNAIGGLQSNSFRYFSEQCEEIYSKVRKAAPLWYALFRHRGEEQAHKWVATRLIPGEFDSETKIVDIVHRNTSTSLIQQILDTTRMVKKSLSSKLRGKH